MQFAATAVKLREIFRDTRTANGPQVPHEDGCSHLRLEGDLNRTAVLIQVGGFSTDGERALAALLA
jgi:hypothetical protein